MKFLEWWKNTSKNSSAECSQTGIENSKKSSRLKKLKKGAKYVYAGFLAYCLFVVGTGMLHYMHTGKQTHLKIQSSTM